MIAKDDKLNILVMDDDNITIMLLKNILQKEYKTFCVTDPTIDIIDYVVTNNISLILLDIEMPNRNGFEVADIVKNNEETKDIPIIFLTANNDKSFLIKAFENDAVDYVNKPFNKAELLARIKTHLSNYIYIKKIQEQQEVIYSQALSSGMNDMLLKISHHWRQPLSIVSLSAQTISIENDMGILAKEDIKKLTGDIIATVNTLSESINFFTNTYGNKNKIESFNISQNFNTLINSVKTLYEDEYLDIKVTNHIKDDINITICTSALKTIIANTISNSIDAYNKNEIEHKEIIFDISLEEKNIVLSISDYAGGIIEENLDKVFDIYFSTKANLNGTGIGLYVVKNLVQNQLNGKIKLQNYEKENKKGVNLKIYLPC